MLSKRAKYGLKALLALARNQSGQPLRTADLAATERIPKKFLEQILLELKREGFVESRMGSGGGYALAKPADLITMGQVVRSIDGPLAPIGCVSQTAYEPCDDCEDEQSCAIRIVMKEVRDRIAAILDGTPLTSAIAEAQLAAVSKSKRGRSAAR